MIRFLLPVALLLPGAALAQGQDVVVTGRGLDAAPGEAAFSVARIDRDRVHDSSVPRSSSLITKAAVATPHSQGPTHVNQLTTRNTSSRESAPSE